MENESPLSIPKIEIPDPQIDSQKFIKDKLDEIVKLFNFTVLFIVGALVIGFLTLLFALGALIIDTWNYHSSVINDQQQSDRQQNLTKQILDSETELLNSIKSIPKLSK